MSTAANVASVPVKAQREVSAVQKFVWCVKRELWEHRWLYLVPLVVAGLTLVASIFSAARLAKMLHVGSDAVDLHKQFLDPYFNASLLLMGTTFLASIWYSLECLQGERRDRSILFWKSLPLSDATTVFAKASIPIVLIPVGTWVLTVATHFVMLLVGSFIFALYGQSPSALWEHVSFGSISVLMFFHLVTGHALWYAPIFGWLIMVSAWAKRAPLVWASVPFLALWLMERIAFGTSNVGHFLQWRLTGGPDSDNFTAIMSASHPLSHVHPTEFFLSLGMWGGLIAAGVFLFVAMRLRRHRDPV